jgi:RHS repeat-associated protein
MKLIKKAKSALFYKLSNALFIRIYIATFLFGITNLSAFGQLALNSPNTVGSYTDPVSITLGIGFSANGTNGTFAASINPGYNTGNAQVSFVSSWLPKMALTTSAALKAQETNNNNVNISTNFFDGLGRVIQTVEKNQTINNSDLIKPYEYDNLGRQVKQYLPYVYANTYPGNYRPAATTTEQQAFYNSGSTINPQSNSPSSKTLLESSPLDRPLEQGMPGDSWQLTGSTGGGHTLKYDYVANNVTAISGIDSTRIAVAYGVAIDNNGARSLTVFGTNGYYDAGDLFVKIAKDENWLSTDGRNGTQEIFINKEGKTVLKRVFVKNPAGTIDIISIYYVYDDLGNLCYVLPQASNPDQLSASNGVNISADVLNAVCYQYQYDEKQRLTGKRRPGKDWEYLVYNNLNQVVASQDGNQRGRNEWSVKKYDGLGRTIITGAWTNSITRDNLQQTVLNQETVFYEIRTTTGNGYSSSAWPQNLSDIYTIDYFDDYNVPGLPTGYTYQVYAGNPNGNSSQTNGLPTISKKRQLSNSAISFWTFNYYDIQGRPIQIQSTNHLSGKDIYNNEYNFNARITKSVHQHSSSAGSISITNRYTYDHHGRLITRYEQIGSDPEVILSQVTYNDLGQIIDKKLHQKSGNTKFIQSIDYRYNIRGWLTSVNDVSLAANSSTNPDDSNTSDADKFGMGFKYEQADLPAYNGNIGSMQWLAAKPAGSSLAPPTLKYDFKYDKLDRLTQAASSTGTTKDENFSEYLAYDKMGNIQSINRWAKLNAGKTLIDNLGYQYNGNQVTQIDDASNNNTYGFSDNGGGAVSKQSNEYIYDANGNLTKDLNKGINLITYNNFNLPVTITWSDGKTLVYDYDSSGGKIKKVFTVGGSVYTTDYVSGLQYEQGQIAFIKTDEGMARKNPGGNNYLYQYFIQDQVGNTRMVIQPVYPGETTADVVQLTNYYAYGLEFKSDDVATLFGYVSGTKDNYLFNGKEIQDGTEMYDFGARNYDPNTGRWFVFDKMADAPEQIDKSPYAFAWGNPVLRRDPDGNCPVCGLAGALVGGFGNLFYQYSQGKVKDFGTGAAAFGIGAVAGGVAGLTMGGSLIVEGGATGLALLGNAVAVGAYGGATESLIRGVGNQMVFGQPYGMQQFAGDAFVGGITGGIAKGIQLNISADAVPMQPVSQSGLDEAAVAGKGAVVKETIPELKGFGIGTYYKYAAKNGEEFFVSPNALKHLEELGLNGSKLGPDYLKLLGQTYKQSINAAIDDVVSRGSINFGQMYFSGGNEIIFGAPRTIGELPAIIHFR